MKKVEVKKRWLGKFVSVRDNWIDDALSKGGLIIIHENQQMILNTNELKNIVYDREIKSKYDGKTYQLANILWKPSDTNLNQLNLV